MGSSSCCTSRKPLSPDGFSPRPVLATSSRSQSKLFKSLPPMIPSWSTRFSKPEDAAELRAIFDDPKSDDEDEGATVKSKRSSINLDAITSKLRKHFSRDSTPSKRHSRSSVGNSEEDIERRKELKRLRDRRIREELSTDKNYDEDAESLHTIASSNIFLPVSHASFPGASPQPPLEMELMTPIFDPSRKPEALPQSALPTSLPKEVPNASIAVVMSASQIISPPLARRHSSVHLFKPEQSMGCMLPTRDPTNPRRNSSICAMPPTPVLKPQRLPSITDPAVCHTSWRLSFVSDRRTCQPRTLDQGCVPSSEIYKLYEPPQQLGALTWLRSQGLPGSSQVIDDLVEHSSDLDTLPSHEQFSTDTNDFGGVDGVLELPQPSVHLHEMRIPQRLASRGLYSPASSPQLSIWGGSRTHLRGHSAASAGSWFSTVTRSHPGKTSSSSAVGNTIPNGWMTGFLRRTSSIYLSNTNSVQLTPNCSQLNLSCPMASSKIKPLFQALNLAVSELTLMRPESTIINPGISTNSSVTSLKVPLAGFDRHLALNSSIGASETASFRHRQTELKCMEVRFPDSMTRDSPITPVLSRFKEEFEVSFPLLQAKQSIFSALHLSKKTKLPPKNFEGTVPVDVAASRRSKGYGYSFADGSPSAKSNSKMSNNASPVDHASDATNKAVEPIHVSEEIPTLVWTRLIRRTQAEHPAKVRDGSKLQDPKRTKVDNGHHGNITNIKRLFAVWNGKQNAVSKSCQVVKAEALTSNHEDGIDKNMKFDQKAPRSDNGENEWSSHLQMQAKAAKQETDKSDWISYLQVQEKAASDASTFTRPGESQTKRIMTPESWTRWPSHTRPERVEPAGPIDDVQPKDFAVKSTAGSNAQCSKGDEKQRHTHSKEHRRSFPVRITKHIRHSWYKLVSKTESLSHPNTSHGMKTSINVGGTLEYPELEILATEEGLMRLREAEEEAEANMRIHERRKRQATYDGSGQLEALEYGEEVGEMTEVSIASPTFYADCLVTGDVEDAEDDMKNTHSDNTKAGRQSPGWIELDKNTFKREKYKTWSGRGRVPNTDSLNLRRSTLDFTIELEIMEKFERDRAIKSAEEAWGDE